MKYDNKIVGSGLFGSVFAYCAKNRGYVVPLLINVQTWEETCIMMESSWLSVWNILWSGQMVWRRIIQSMMIKIFNLSQEYEMLIQKESAVIFGGRFSEYKFYDMG